MQARLSIRCRAAYWAGTGPVWRQRGEGGIGVTCQPPHARMQVRPDRVTPGTGRSDAVYRLRIATFVNLRVPRLRSGPSRSGARSLHPDACAILVG